MTKPAPRARRAPAHAGAARIIARAALVGFAAAGFVGAAAWMAGCSGWDPKNPFERNAPEVDQAIRDLDAGQLESAEEALERYLGTGACGDAGIQLPDAVRQKPSGAFDLGLVLFALAERYGHRFGEEELGDGGAEDPQKTAQRDAEIECALVLVKAIAADPKVPAELRARARYLAGNLEFLRRRYEEAVKYYDEALALVPGLYEEAGGDGIGRDAAWNRAIALRRIEDQKDAGPDSSPDSGDDASDGSDGGDDGGPDAGEDAGQDGGDDGGDDGGNDGGGDDGGQDGGGDDAGQDGGGQDAGQDGGGQDAGQDAGPQDQEPDSGPPKPNEPPPRPEPSTAPQQDDRILNQLEEAPTYQEQEAKARAGVRRGRVMEDK